ncbi:RUN domain protein, partial [Opisthorchis viverrini]
ALLSLNSLSEFVGVKSLGDCFKPFRSQTSGVIPSHPRFCEQLQQHESMDPTDLAEQTRLSYGLEEEVTAGETRLKLMYDPLSAYATYCFPAREDTYPRNDLSSHTKPSVLMNSNDLTDHHIDMLQHNNVNQFDSSDPNSVGSNAPMVSSVWLEQGDYFFDDEFSVPFDTNLQDDLVQNELNMNGMTVSLGPTVPPARTNLQLEQSRSDSCICTPGDSGESGLISAHPEQLVPPYLSEPPHRHPQLMGAMQNTPVTPSQNGAIYESTNGVMQSELNRVGTESGSGHHKRDFQSNGVSQPSPNASQFSGQSGSTSWMQMVMERSCNPDLKALLSRAAMAVDYKLAYGESLPIDSSTGSLLQQLIRERFDERPNNCSRGLARSLSQGDLLTAASLAGLRYALDQAAQCLPRADERSVEAKSVGVTARGESVDSPSISDSAEVGAPNTTTWAKRHGSRESLKRKFLTTKEPTTTPQVPAVSDTSNKLETSDQPENVNPWRMMKQAHGTLITWNQLKRTLKTGQPLERGPHTRESRREQHGRRACDVVSEQVNTGGTDLCVTSDTQLLENAYSRPTCRSRSQPVSANHYMYRFSGTLLEIFMRAKADEGAVRCVYNASSDLGDNLDSATRMRSSAADPRPTGSSSQMPATAVRIGHRRSVGSGTEPTKLLSETDRHPLLRGDRILPQRFQPPDLSTTSSSGEQSNNRFTRHFGAQFPSLDAYTQAVTTVAPNPLRCSSPVWSPSLPTRCNMGGIKPSHYAFIRHSHPRHSSRPQSFDPSRTAIPHKTPPVDDKSSNHSPELAACLTASVGPDSPYMAALRADYMADGYSAGWLGNPRASIAYPGLGLLSIPRPSRLTGAAFLSHTLPDLSFLGKAGAEEERKGTPTMPKRVASCRFHGRITNGHCGAKCTCRSVPAGRNGAPAWLHPRSRLTGKPRRPELKAYTFSPDLTDVLDQSNNDVSPHDAQNPTDGKPSIPDIVPINRFGASDSSDADPRLRPHLSHRLRYKVDRSTSEPELNSTSRLTFRSTGDDQSYENPSALLTSSGQNCYGWDDNNSSNKSYDLFTPHGRRPKKSVSFSGKIRLLRVQNGVESPTSPEPKVIPRNWGLYGQETPLAEFNPRNSPGRDTNQPGELPRQSDVDVRYHAMVNDVIKAVQETVAYYSTATTSNPDAAGNGCTTADPLPYSAIAALGSAGRQPLLAVVGPLTVLLSDGLLPPTKPIFITKPRTRLWQMVEESCRPGPLLSGVAYRVLSDAVSQVKALTSITLEKVKFKAFICACLNAKALPMWLNAVVANESLLSRFYCEDAFVRQCRATQRGLHADLLTHLEQLLAYPFNLDLAVEVRKPLFTDPSTGANRNLGSQSTGAAIATTSGPLVLNSTQQPGLPPKVAARANIPPAVVVTRKATPTAPSVPARNRLSPPLPSGGTTATVHHYPQHHLPGQRPIPLKNTTSRSSRQTGDESGVSTSASSEPRTTDPTKSTGKRPTQTSQAPQSASATASQVRGRLKTALSNFRRSAPLSESISKKATTTEPGAPTNSMTATPSRPTTTTGIPTSDSISKPPSRFDNNSRPRPPLPDTKPNIASKLRQPSNISGP